MAQGQSRNTWRSGTQTQAYSIQRPGSSPGPVWIGHTQATQAGDRCGRRKACQVTWVRMI